MLKDAFDPDGVESIEEGLRYLLEATSSEWNLQGLAALERAASTGCKKAKFHLAKALVDKTFPIILDPSRAIVLMLEAADDGFNLAKSMCAHFVATNGGSENQIGVALKHALTEAYKGNTDAIRDVVYVSFYKFKYPVMMSLCWQLIQLGDATLEYECRRVEEFLLNSIDMATVN